LDLRNKLLLFRLRNFGKEPPQNKLDNSWL
jgi:hypothetical protein